MTETDHAFPLMNGRDLVELRGGPARNASYRRLHHRCMKYVLDYRCYRFLLSREDAEDIVSQAVAEEIPAIVAPEVGVEEVSIRLKRALNRVRARYVRRSEKETLLEAVPREGKDLITVIRLKEIVPVLSNCLQLAFAGLTDRDRNLLIDHYGFERRGFVKNGASPTFASANAHKVALWRARKRFLDALHCLLESAAWLPQDSDQPGGRRMLGRSQASRTPDSGSSGDCNGARGSSAMDRPLGVDRFLTCETGERACQDPT
jgi:hypothetical protein